MLSTDKINGFRTSSDSFTNKKLFHNFLMKILRMLRLKITYAQQLL